MLYQNSEIVNFFDNRSIFVTGASGFLGKVLVEKLIRSCLGIKSIFILLRAKKGKTLKQRLDDFIESPIFSQCSKSVLLSKIVPLPGDLSAEQLGLSNENRNLLLANVSIVFHCAASVRFDEPSKESLKVNFKATQCVFELCKEMTNLKAFVHVSTAYAYCHLSTSEEKVYSMKVSGDHVSRTSEWMDEETFGSSIKTVFEGRPNVYTFTKALAENYLKDNCGNVPVAIVRPSIITASKEEPVPGWVDSVNGPAGASLLASLGICRAINFESTCKIDIIPVDIVSNAMIAVAWSLGKFKKFNELKVYNITSGDVNPITFGEFFYLGRKALAKAPSIKIVRPPVKLEKTTKHNTIQLFLIKYFSEYSFALFLDLMLFVLGYKTRAVKVLKKMYRAYTFLDFFSHNEWSFPSKNLTALFGQMSDTDKSLFNFDVKAINWEDYMNTFYLGMRKFLLKEDESNIPQARKRLTRLRLGFYAVEYTFYAATLYSIYFYFSHW